MALANISIGKYEAARILLDSIVKDASKSDVVQKAQEYISLLKGGGFTP